MVELNANELAGMMPTAKAGLGKTKTKNKNRNKDLSKGLWAASGVEGDSSGQPFREGRPVQKHS